MLLAVDIGNTHTVFGLFEGTELRRHFRVETRVGRTSDELAAMLSGLLQLEGMALRQITAGIISSVVPPATDAVERLFARHLGQPAVSVGPGIKTGMPVLYDNPREVGADRIVNAVAAFDRYQGGAIVVDFGTATTFDVVTVKGEYAGGIIAPGLMTAAEGLFRATAKLPRVEIVRPRSAIGKNTVASIQAGLVFGYAGMVDALVTRIRGELDFSPRVVATGGLGALVAAESATIDDHDEFLTLTGLRIIHERNRG
ncbi:MAG: type III pantothenate kinase [Myxococcales bacterium]|nr:type III pantothenate kinase [Myxococcales bacterium]